MFPEDLDVTLSWIFAYLLPKELSKCRLVCTHWQKIIDKRIQILWYAHCKKDYPDIYYTASIKSNKCNGWYFLYKSLSLWSKLPQAPDTTYYIIGTLGPCDTVQSFQVFCDGIVGIKTGRKLIYFNIDTLRPLFQNSIIFNQVYRENFYIMTLHKKNNQLIILVKNNEITNRLYTVNAVKQFLLLETSVYYIASNNYLYAFKKVNGTYTSSRITYMLDVVLSLGTRNGYLYLLTHRLTVQMLDGDELINIQVSETLLKNLRKYNFLEELDWRTFYHWWTFCKKIHRTILLSEIVTIRAYGQILFVGFDWGVLHIYDSSNSDDLEEVMMRNPLKVYSFMERDPVSLCPIFQIDVVEGKDSHIVLVAMPKKCVIVKFSHFLNE